MAELQNIYALLSGLVFVMSATAAGAQSREDWRATENPQTSVPAKKEEKRYEGVTPGAGNNLPRVDELRHNAGTWVTWPGFMIRQDGATQIFLQTTLNVKYEIIEKKYIIIIELKEANVFLSNNRNPLVTTHINTPLKRAYIKKKKKSVALVLELKIKSVYQISQQSDNDGYHYLFIDFPPGNYPTHQAPSTRPTFSGYGTPASKDQVASSDAVDEIQNQSRE